MLRQLHLGIRMGGRVALQERRLHTSPAVCSSLFTPEHDEMRRSLRKFIDVEINPHVRLRVVSELHALEHCTLHTLTL